MAATRDFMVVQVFSMNCCSRRYEVLFQVEQKFVPLDFMLTLSRPLDRVTSGGAATPDLTTRLRAKDVPRSGSRPQRAISWSCRTPMNPPPYCALLANLRYEE